MSPLQVQAELNFISEMGTLYLFLTCFSFFFANQILTTNPPLQVQAEPKFNLELEHSLTLFCPCLAETFANARFLDGFMTYDIVRHADIQEFPNLNRRSKGGTYEWKVNYSRAEKFTRPKSVHANLGEW